MSLTSEERVEMQLQKFIQMKQEKQRLEENMELTKGEIVEYFRQHPDEEVIRIRHDDNYDIKATFSERNRTVFDKEKLAEDMLVSDSAVNRDFLIKSVEDGKLTFDRFKSYHYQDKKEMVSVRLTKTDSK